MCQQSAYQRLGRRIIAIAAAYAIALSSLIASFGGALADAAAGADPGTPICHTASAGHSSPADDQDNRACIGNCCVGCLTLMAAMPPPPASAVVIARASSRAFAPPATAAFAGRPQVRSHRSRAPPQPA